MPTQKTIVICGPDGHLAPFPVSEGTTYGELAQKYGLQQQIDPDILEFRTEAGAICPKGSTVDVTRIFTVRVSVACGGSVNRGGGAQTPEHLLEFWQRSWNDLKKNIAVVWPLFAALLLYLGGAAKLLELAEHGKSYRACLYLTWITMTTVGYGDVTPSTPTAHVIVSVDALVGTVLIGAMIWLVTASLQRA